MNTANPRKNKPSRVALAVWSAAGVMALACLLPAPFVARAQGHAQDAKPQSAGSWGGKTSGAKAKTGKPLTAGANDARLPLVDFDRDVRPILSENCFTCHGFDGSKRMAGLRLDREEGATQKLDSGETAVVPGDVAHSALAARVAATDALQMPPVSSNKTLTRAQIATLRTWIAQGGKYAKHWAYMTPVRPALPAVKNTAWPRSPIDKFILARLEKEGLAPSSEADRATLIRRVTLDLTGLPPTPDEVSAFVADKSVDAYGKVLDRLFASPHYGERMAQSWLDLSRYADTHGFHIDSQRDMWKWREWVINAYNTNLPYDQFTMQQLAGDLLPNATIPQKVASGFNRNHPINFEGGAIPEEYAAAYIFDRIDTTATTFMGMTMRCAQCHDHKYDPITQKDFYRFYAYFHNVPEIGLDGQKGNAVPFLKVPSPEQEAGLIEAANKITGLENARANRLVEAAPALAEWIKTAPAAPDKSLPAVPGLVARYALNENAGSETHDASGKITAVALVKGKVDWKPGRVGNALNFDGSTYVEAGDVLKWERTDKFSYGAWVYPTGTDAMTVLSRMNDNDAYRGYDLYLSGGKAFVHLVHKWDSNAIRVNTRTNVDLNKWHHLFVTYDGSSKARGVHIYVDGKLAGLDITHDTLTDTIQTTVPTTIGRRTPAAPFKGMIGDVRAYDRELTGGEVAALMGEADIRQILATPEDTRTIAQKSQLAAYYLDSMDAPYKAIATELSDWKTKKADIDAHVPNTMVMQEMDKPRDTFVLIRGQYDKPGEKITAGLPGFLPSLGEYPANRLGLARWLVNPNHPLTSRVAVNRYWQMLFGTGLVKTAEDFGTQGERPSHPELLDWMATEFIRTHWDMKNMMRLIVTSATYRQVSRATPRLRERDPENRLLARGPRFRLPAENIRDQALDVSGLLVPKIGGPSVKPYQPVGLWEDIAFGGDFSAQTYVQDHGDNLYRRGMYTFWKRTCPPPSLQTFDAPEREFCMVRRSTTNTPLQALALMNDPTYVEASRKLAERLLTQADKTTTARINLAFRLCVSRPATPQEIKILSGLLSDQLARFHKDAKAADNLLGVGESKRDTSLDKNELAAWTLLASTVLNLDETITIN